MAKCNRCDFDSLTSSKFCPNCGMKLQPSREEASPNFSSLRLFWDTNKGKSAIALGVLAGLSVLAFGLGGLGGGSDRTSDGPSNALTVEQFGCSYGTEVASAIIRNNSQEAVNAFVTVGLYSSEGTLQWSGTNYGLVEAGGKSLINVRLGGYIYSVGQCKIINTGY